MTDGPSGLRKDYCLSALLEGELASSPIEQFARWFQDAINVGVPEPNVMTLATATPEGRPSARIVLLKGFDERGFAFFTNYESRKGRELANNPWAALVVFWQALERQVRVEGHALRVSSDESDAYFRSRPRGSRLGAWTARQSDVVSGRPVLEERYEEVDRAYPGDQVPRPPHWGGYRVVPEAVEFWQGRPSRLHDRLRYCRSGPDDWRIERLAP